MDRDESTAHWNIGTSKPDLPHLFTLTEEYDTGANHIFETLQRVIADLGSRKFMSRALYISVETCTTENKNWYTFPYIESFVAWNVFENFKVSFLRFWNTHEHINQALSKTSERFRSTDLVSLSDFPYLLK